MNAAEEGRCTNVLKIGLGAAAILLLVTSAAVAADFGWTPDFNIAAQADPSGFRVRLATRFRIGDAQIDAVLSNIPDPADTYIVLRLGELSHRPPEYVIERYRGGKKKGWGAFAKSLGIKPGSKEFHALKRGHDLSDDGWGKGKEKDKGQGKGKKE